MREAVETFLQERTPGARIPFISSDLTPTILAGFEGLISHLQDLPPAEWAKWQAHMPEDDEPEDGLIVRSRGEGKDPKMYWQWRPRTFGPLRQNGARFTPELTTFIVACKQLHRRCVDTSVRFAQEMDRQMPGYNFAGHMSSYVQHVLRILRYDASATTAARNHVDKCFLTLHLAESRDGLWVWGKPVSDIQDQAIVFPGLKAEIMTGKRILAAEHKVIQTPGVTATRWSVVFFAHTDTPLPQNVEHLTHR